MGYQSFENLEVWNKACTLAIRVYKALRDCKDYAFKDQMTKSSVSIASNIAEGAERDSKQEFIRFLHIAKGSAAELRTQLYIAKEVEVIDKEMANELISEVKHISAMLHKAATTIKQRYTT